MYVAKISKDIKMLIHERRSLYSVIELPRNRIHYENMFDRIEREYPFFKRISQLSKNFFVRNLSIEPKYLFTDHEINICSTILYTF